MNVSLEQIKRWLQYILILIVVLPMIAICGGLSYIIGLSTSAQVMAYSLAPPEYPGSQFVGRWSSGGSESYWDRRYFHTADSVQQVLAFYQRRMPGFQQDIAPGIKGPIYRNGRTNTSWLAKRASVLASNSLICQSLAAHDHRDYTTCMESNLPAASVTFFQDPKDPSGTEIWIWFSWPAP